MVTSEEEITRRLKERDLARSARRARAATAVGELARRHTELAGQLDDLERQLGEVLITAGEVIAVPELVQVTDVPAADLTRWRDQAAKPVRSGKRKRSSAKKNHALGKDTSAATEPRDAYPGAPVSPKPESAGVAVDAASS